MEQATTPVYYSWISCEPVPQERIVYEVKDKEMTATATGFAPEVSTSNAGMASNVELCN